MQLLPSANQQVLEAVRVVLNSLLRRETASQDQDEVQDAADVRVRSGTVNPLINRAVGSTENKVNPRKAFAA